MLVIAPTVVAHLGAATMPPSNTGISPHPSTNWWPGPPVLSPPVGRAFVPHRTIGGGLEANNTPRYRLGRGQPLESLPQHLAGRREDHERSGIDALHETLEASYF